MYQPQGAPLPDGIDTRPQLDAGARAIRRWAIGDHDLTAAIESFAAHYQLRLNAGLPLRSFTQNLLLEGLEPNQILQGPMRWNDWVYVWGYTGTVGGITFDQDIQQSQFYDFRDAVLVSVQDSQNQAITITSSGSNVRALRNGLPLSEFAGKGGLPARILATGYQSGSEQSFQFAIAPGSGIERVGFVNITAHYVRLPLFGG
jgi:hypothetical protein